jgi:hypothetical protein
MPGSRGSPSRIGCAGVHRKGRSPRAAVARRITRCRLRLRGVMFLPVMPNSPASTAPAYCGLNLHGHAASCWAARVEKGDRHRRRRCHLPARDANEATEPAPIFYGRPGIAVLSRPPITAPHFHRETRLCFAPILASASQIPTRLSMPPRGSGPCESRLWFSRFRCCWRLPAMRRPSKERPR